MKAIRHASAGGIDVDINILKKMKEHKYLLLGLSLFFFNICFVSCRNQKAESVVQSDSVGEEEIMNSNAVGNYQESGICLWWCKDGNRYLLFGIGYQGISFQ